MTWGWNTGNLFFMLELLLGEMIFLYPVPKKKHFALRLAMGAGALLGLSGWVPQLANPALREVSNLIRFTLMFFLSVGMLRCCFSLKGEMLFSMCVAGYAVQHYSFRIHLLLSRLPIGLPEARGPGAQSRVMEMAVILICYLFTYLTFGKFSERNECYRNSDRRFNYLSIFIIFLCVGLSRLAGLTGEGRMGVTSNIYSIICCLLALYIQFYLHLLNRSEREKAALDQIRREEKKQYEITRNAMESINIKAHDLKHKLSAYDAVLPRDEIESLKQDIDVYDSHFHTGLDALDVLLNEKMLRCKNKGIQMSVSGRWAALSFMATMDVYSLFGNAIDNAIEAVERLSEPEKKLIDVSIEERGEMLFLSFTNYFSGQLRLEDGLPRTTKETEIGDHGYGMKSMRLIAEKYGGELIVSVREDVFSLNIYLSGRKEP